MNTTVNKKIAVLLQGKGFDVPVRNYFLLKDKDESLHEGFEDDYWGDNRIVNWNMDIIGVKPFRGFVSAPTIAEVVMWLYEKHGIWVSVDKMFSKHFFHTVTTDNEHTSKESKEYYNTPSEAYSAAIEYVLNNLI